MDIDNIDELYDAIKKMKSIQEAVKNYIVKAIKNKSIDLETRWELFVDNKKLFPIKSFLIHYLELDTHGVNYYDDFGYERYQTIDVEELVELIEEGVMEGIDLNILKEEIMEKGHSGFIFDW